MLTGGQGLHAILDVTLEGQKTTHPSILKEYQQHPVKGGIIHIDLQEVRLDQPIQARVVVELVGEPVGVTEGGVLSQVNREVTVQALPMEIPEHLELDVSRMAIGDTLRLVDLPPPARASSTSTIPRRRCSRRSRCRPASSSPSPRRSRARSSRRASCPRARRLWPEGEEAPAEGEAGEEPSGEQETNED